MYSLVKRQCEVEILPLARDQKLAVFSYSPLGAGMLTGKYSQSKNITARLNDKKYYKQRYDDEEYFLTARRFCSFAENAGYDPVSLAIAWVMKHPEITAPIIGGRNVGQLETGLKALELEIDDFLYEKIAGLSRTPAPAHDRLEETRDANNLLR